MRIIRFIAVSLLAGFGAGAVAAPRPADLPVEHFPLGVYWPWERTGGIAHNAGVDAWTFVRQTCRLLKQEGCDTIWLVNIGLEDTRKLLKITRPLGLKILPGLGEIEPRNHGEVTAVKPGDPASMERAVAYYRRTIPAVVAAIGEDREGVLAWVLGDEPTGGAIGLLDEMRILFAEADPGRPVLTVTMWPTTPDVVAKTRLTTFCIDLYPFFGPKSPNGPHTPAASAAFYTNNLQRLVDDAGRDGRTGWIMPQCYGEVWGPWELRPDGTGVALPGAHWHWRMPTLPEMRWQIWEGLRCGAKGILFFVLLGNAQGNPTAKPVEEKSVVDALFTEPTPVGPDALLDHLGRPTEQFRTMAGLFRRLAPHRRLLRRLRPTGQSFLTSDTAKVGCFLDPKTGGRYAVVVNPDMAAPRTVGLTPAAGVGRIEDVLGKKRLPLRSAGGRPSASVRLHPGDGMLLRLVR